ncbi:MAG: hypothetical protein ACTHNP_08385 [Solirubrobacterales bacterium]
MAQGSIVTAPDGTQWRVRRRWLDRPLPDLRERFQTNRSHVSVGNVLDSSPNLDFGEAFQGDSPAAVIVAIVVLVIVVFVLLPLLGVALELIALVFLLGSGLIGRVLLGRPWIVEALKVGEPEERATYAVQGWRQSSEALRQLRTAVTTSGRPDIAAGRRLSTRPISQADGPK